MLAQEHIFHPIPHPRARTAMRLCIIAFYCDRSPLTHDHKIQAIALPLTCNMPLGDRGNPCAPQCLGHHPFGILDTVERKNVFRREELSECRKTKGDPPGMDVPYRLWKFPYRPHADAIIRLVSSG